MPRYFGKFWEDPGNPWPVFSGIFFLYLFEDRFLAMDHVLSPLMANARQTYKRGQSEIWK
jgi:hypothetical protein